MSSSQLVAQLTPVVLMISIIGMNHLIANQRADRKTETEASRLRCALAAALRALLDLYNKNLQLIEQKADYILSSRSSVVLYRANLGRLATLLEETAIQRVVGIFAQNERIEAVLSAHSNFKGGLTYQFPVADAKFDEWKSMFEQAASDSEVVCQMLEGRNQTSVPLIAHVALPQPAYGNYSAKTFTGLRMHATGALSCLESRNVADHKKTAA